MTAALALERRPHAGSLAAAAVGAAVVLGALVGVYGFEVVLVVAGAGAVAVVAARPVVGAYTLALLTPLVVGIDRGLLLPVVRPNEALLIVAGIGLALRAALHLRARRPVHLDVRPVELAIGALAVTSSVLPLLWMYGRGRGIALDDLLYAAALWKFLLLYVVVRVGVRTEAQVRTTLGLAMAAGVFVAVVAVLQSLQLFGVPELLGRWWAPLEDQEALSIGRGSSTLASAIAVGDVMAFLLAAAIAWWARDRSLRPLMVALALVFVLGGLGSGQFSGVFALVIAVAVAAMLTGTARRILVAAVPVVLVGVLLLQPVIETRLEGFQSQSGVPHSWSARLENLQTFFWPEIAADWNWALGVRTSARVPAPEEWRDWVFIESGYTWLLWNGGLPLLAAFVAFVWLALRTVVPIARRRADAVGVAATASVAALAVLVVLMLLDPHLTMRGTADLSFMLLALAMTRTAAETDRPPVGPPGGDGECQLTSA